MSLHDQFPTARLTETQYETALVHLGEQLTYELVRQNRWDRDEAAKVAIDALANTCQASADQTMRDWLTAAGKRVDVSTANCIGV